MALFLLQSVNIIVILLMLFMFAVIIKKQPTTVQVAFLIYDIFSIIFVVGIQLELTYADTVEAALSGLCVQYVGQAGFLMGILWFISVFARFKIPAWVYKLQIVISTVTLVGIFTAEHHPYFYSSMEILRDGMYNRIRVTGGPIWYLHYLYFFTTMIAILIMCIRSYRQSTSIQRKRILYIMTGIGSLVAEIILKGFGAFGSYNPVTIVMTFTMFCMMIAVVRYGYFGSLHAAVDNAFNHGDEGLIILDMDGAIIFVNQRMDQFYPGIQVGDSLAAYKDIASVLKMERPMIKSGKEIYEIRSEYIIENGEKSGFMLWFINQTEQYLHVKELQKENETKTKLLMEMSHELRTPLNTMLGMNEMILRESGEKTIQEYAREIQSAGENMVSLVDQLLVVSADDIQEDKKGNHLSTGELLPEPVPKEKINLSGKRILAVDDNAKNLLIIKYLLKRTGIEIETAPGGKQAVQCCRVKTYDLILMDHMMPEIDGIEPFHLIRQDAKGKNRETKIIAVTANAIPGARELYEREGFADYISKPIRPELLEQLLAKYLGRLQVKEAKKEKELPALKELAGIGMNIESGLMYADDDVAFYQSLLMMFAQEREEKEKKLQETTEYSSFVVQVHGLKGEARGIGADRLGELFYELELAGKEQDEEQIRALYPETMEQWKLVTAAIEKEFGITI